MSLQTRLRRVKNLTKRIRDEEKYAEGCLGEVGYCCKVNIPETGVMMLTTRQCFNHSKLTKIRYDRMQKSLREVKERNEKLGG